MASEKPKILIVDDEPQILDTLEDIFFDDYEVIKALSADSAIEAINADSNISAIVMDIKMPEKDGISAGREIRKIAPDIPLIFHTAYPGEYEEEEIDASENPFDYIEKGGSLFRLERSVRNAVNSWLARNNQTDLVREAEISFEIIGSSPAMLDVFRKIKKAAQNRSPVLILGETGTGKELVARAIHKLSKRKVMGILNCNHKDPGHIESELFGHNKEAFSSAGDRMGVVEYCDGGTLFLDEIGDLDITTQAKLLRVIEYGKYNKIGDPAERNSDFRVICATNKDLDKLIEVDRFREDLYYRINSNIIRLPALREKIEDIEKLAAKFADRVIKDENLPYKKFDSSAVDVLRSCSWPGNVRQLKNVVEELVRNCESSLVIDDDVNCVINSSSESFESGYKQRIASYQRALILEALRETDNNVAAAAEILDLERTTLYKKIKQLGIKID